MKHNMITMRLPPDLHEAYRGLSLDGRKAALGAMRQALQRVCKANSRAATVKDSSTVAVVAPDPASSPAEPAVTPDPEPVPATPAPTEDAPENQNPFPDLMKEFVHDSGW